MSRPVTVTSVEKAGSGVYAVYTDGMFFAELSSESVARGGLAPGREISPETLEELRHDDCLKQAKNKAARLLGFKDRTKAELIRRLSEDFDRETAEEAVEKLEALGLINEESYAFRLARDLHGMKKFAPSRIVRELVRRGIPEELAEEAAAQFDGDDTADRIRAVIEKKYTESIREEKGRRRAVNALLRLGYSLYDIRRVLTEYPAGGPQEDGEDF